MTTNIFVSATLCFITGLTVFAVSVNIGGGSLLCGFLCVTAVCAYIGGRVDQANKMEEIKEIFSAEEHPDAKDW